MHAPGVRTLACLCVGGARLRDIPLKLAVGLHLLFGEADLLEQAADGAEPCAREGLHRRLRDHVPEFCSREARVAVGLRRESAATRGVGIGDDLLHLILSVAK